MIEMTHKQARRWLREALDARQDDGRRLPETQWTALEAHLENCTECRAYRARLEGLERSARRALRSGWDSAGYHSSVDFSERVLARRSKRSRQRRQAVTYGLAALGLFLLLAAGLGRWFGREREPIPASSLEEIILPTAAPGAFRGLVAYHAPLDGALDIFLASSPDQPPTNLTARPGNDSDPAWSPDGEWLAFLSDRSGKNEVHVMNTAGTRVVRLTDSPGVRWEGPLSWSADGQRIALAGVRAEQGWQRWVYIVPLDGSGAYSLARSRGGAQPEFAPFGDQLAFAYADEEREGVILYHLETGKIVSANWAPGTAQSVPPGSALDWSPDGTGVAYVAGTSTSEREAGSQVVAARNLNYSITLFYDFQHNFRVDDSPRTAAFHAASYTPAGAVAYLRDMSKASGESPYCWTVVTRSPGMRGADGSAYAHGGICVESGLDRSSWTPDGDWLVVHGRTLDEIASGAPSGLYAVRLPPHRGEGSPSQQYRAEIQRIANAGAQAGTPRVRPALRRYQKPLDISPRQVQDHTVLPPASLEGAGGEVLFARPHGRSSVIARINPNGTGGMLLYATDSAARCPAWSPDGARVAFVAGPPGLDDTPRYETLSGHNDMVTTPGPEPTEVPRASGDRLSVIDRDGRELVRLSARGDRPVYDCPVWSPDGAYLAALVEGEDGWRLEILPSAGDGESYTFQIVQPASETSPRWLPNGRRVLVTQYIPSRDTREVLAVDLPESPFELPRMKVLRTLAGWGDVSAMAVSPDAWQLGVLTRFDYNEGNASAMLLRLSTRHNAEAYPVVLGDLEDSAAGFGPFSASAAQLAPYLKTPSRMLVWLADEGLGILLRGPAGSPAKTQVRFYNLKQQALETVVDLEDSFFDAAWSPDGRYLMVSAESGVWVVDVEASRQGRSSPVWISPEPIYDIDWR